MMLPFCNDAANIRIFRVANAVTWHVLRKNYIPIGQNYAVNARLYQVVGLLVRI